MIKRNSGAGVAGNVQTFAQAEKLSTKLAVIGGAFATFGDLLATVGAALAIEEIAEEERLAELEKNELQGKLADMQRQIDDLKMQIERLTNP